MNGSKLSSCEEKNGDIQLCVDYQDLIRGVLKYNFPFPDMKLILQQVAK